MTKRWMRLMGLSMIGPVWYEYKYVMKGESGIVLIKKKKKKEMQKHRIKKGKGWWDIFVRNAGKRDKRSSNLYLQ